MIGRYKIKAIDIEYAIMDHIGVRSHYIVPNVSWGIWINGEYLHECDILSLTKSGYATEVEIKVSKQDILRDKEKMHGHYSSLIKNFYFAVPENLKEYALLHIPDRAGLFSVRFGKYYPEEITDQVFVEKERKCTANNNAYKWNEENLFQLLRLGTMRILKSNRRLIKEIYRRESR